MNLGGAEVSGTYWLTQRWGATAEYRGGAGTTDVDRISQVYGIHRPLVFMNDALFGVQYQGKYRLPCFQFERRQLLPGLREVLAAMPDELNPLDVAQWFLAPNPDLEAKDRNGFLSPRDWLLRGEPVATVVEVARGIE